MVYNAKVFNGKVEWEVEGKPLTDERFERYCLLMFEYFVKESQEELMRAS
jgi:hypothetical protein